MIWASVACDHSLPTIPARVARPHSSRSRTKSGRNTWQLVTEKAHKVSVAGNAFTITSANGASLRGTVVSPPGAKIETADQSLDHEINYHGRHANYSFPRTIISVTGGEFFLTVMTIQKEAAPDVEIVGNGTAAKATVGSRGVSFDGAKVVLGKHSGGQQ